MSERKHKSGYELLKEKYAALETKMETVANELIHAKKQRDEWKARYAVRTSELESTVNGQAISVRGLSMENTELRKNVAFLLDHCPFWVRWKYRKHFEKGE